MATPSRRERYKEDRKWRKSQRMRKKIYAVLWLLLVALTVAAFYYFYRHIDIVHWHR